MIRLLGTLLSVLWTIVYGHVHSGYQPPSQPPPPHQPQEQPSTLAVMTLIAGIASWTIFPFVASLVGVVLGWMELSNIKKGQSPEKGKTITQIGFYLCVGQIVLSILGGCVLVAIYMGLFAFIGGAALLGETAGG